MTTRQQPPLGTPPCRVPSEPASLDRCSALWRQLVWGELEIVHTTLEPGRSALILRRRDEPARPLSARAREVLERTLLGERRKVIAYDLGVSVSMLALTLKASLAGLGLGGKPALAPSALVMLLHGARGARPPSGTFIRDGDGEHEGQRLTVVSHVLDGAILRALSPSQRAVMELVAIGCSGADIAARRDRSCRTVINQISTATRRLGVSGRFELLRCFAIGEAAPIGRRGSQSRSAERTASPPLPGWRRALESDVGSADSASSSSP